MKNQLPQLNKLKKQSKPSAEFEKVLWAKLSDAYDHQYPSMIFCIRHRIAVPIAVLCLFAMTGVGSYAYGSPAVTEEHVLFPVKQGMEQVQECTHRSPGGRAEFFTRMTERRLEEGEFLFEHNEVSLPHVERIDASFDQAVTSITDTPEDYPSREQMINRLRTHQARYEYLLMQTIELESEDTTPEELRNVLLDFRVRIDESGLNGPRESSPRDHQRRHDEVLTR